MIESPLQHGAWLAICDGAKALLVENTGDHTYPKLETRAQYSQVNPATHEQGSSPPGRVFSSIGGRRGAVEETDYHRQAEHDFLNSFADHVAHAVEQHRIRKLFLVAPARALGIMRAALSPRVRHVLAGEIERDYGKMPLHEIEQHLAALEQKK
ncbi:MAG: host attachment protein [Alphaproteobacteria bacterium]|nr:host attachment protein [Alphaproteobacteria bacterium]MBL6937001.1 host attachment protein [Alphaproteobacteria bacterium]MBL7097770.1 host attachment protein [Alphaproteobacteria bacterium]